MELNNEKRDKEDWQHFTSYVWKNNKPYILQDTSESQLSKCSPKTGGCMLIRETVNRLHVCTGLQSVLIKYRQGDK